MGTIDSCRQEVLPPCRGLPLEGGKVYLGDWRVRASTPDRPPGTLASPTVTGLRELAADLGRSAALLDRPLRVPVEGTGATDRDGKGAVLTGLVLMLGRRARGVALEALLWSTGVPATPPRGVGRLGGRLGGR